jgi:hypothetical protein
MHQLIRSPHAQGMKTESLPFEGAFIIDDIRILAAAILGCAALAAQAQSTDAAPDTHWKFGIQAGTVHDNSKAEPVLQLGFGYDIDRTWSVEALASVNLLIERDGFGSTGIYEFDHAYGGRVLAALPLGQRWRVVGGLGVVEVHEDPDLDYHVHGRNRAEPLVSAALMYRASRRWSMGVETSTFAQSHTFNLGLRGEIHF